MRISPAWKTGILTTALCLFASGQNTPGKDAQVNEAKGIPPRAAPAEYQAKAPAGKVTIAADFPGHSVPTPQGTFASEDYVVVEVAFFGPPEARLKISIDDFSLRINKKKTPLPSEPFGVVLSSLKDPEWAPPSTGESKSKSGINTGGQGEPPPAPVHMPFPLVRAMQQRVQKAALREGDRALPQAGLIFFPYHGKGTGIHSLELTYTGPAGKAILTLQP
jgi:hypothetical protein